MLSINIENFLVMSIGNEASSASYTIGGTQFLAAYTVKDHGVLLQNNFSTSKQCVKLAETGIRKL